MRHVISVINIWPTNQVDFGRVGTGESKTVPLSVTSNAEGLAGVTVSVSPSGLSDSEGLILGGGHVLFYNASGGALIQPGQSIPLENGGGKFSVVLSGVGASPGTATTGVILTVIVP